MGHQVRSYLKAFAFPFECVLKVCFSLWFFLFEFETSQIREQSHIGIVVESVPRCGILQTQAENSSRFWVMTGVEEEAAYITQQPDELVWRLFSFDIGDPLLHFFLEEEISSIELEHSIHYAELVAENLEVVRVTHPLHFVWLPCLLERIQRLREVAFVHQYQPEIVVKLTVVDVAGSVDTVSLAHALSKIVFRK